MDTIAPGITIIDVEHLHRAQVIGACLIEGAHSAALVDPGPASTAPTLMQRLAERGLSAGDLEAVVLTHIHLDHAAATGQLVRDNPAIRVYVHERGARHVVDPSRLVESARRLWPDNLDELWGVPLPVPAEQITTLTGGERIAVAGRHIAVADTPGHASHHLSFFDQRSGTAFVGDTAGVCVTGTSYPIPPTPPPDIDIAAWNESLDLIANWQPARLVLTHFGGISDVEAHLATLREALHVWSERVRLALENESLSAEEGEAAFCRWVEDSVRAELDDATAESVLQATPPPLSWHGLVRYWRKRG